jgi:pimeloyl-ACP methyl ester carboxylesterase
VLVSLPDGRRLEIWETGDPGGRPVFFLPGCPDSRWAAWPATDAAREAGVRLVSVNRPGYGGSDPHPTSHDSVAADLVAVADALGIERIGLVGMSVGGVYALATAAAHPERVESVVTVSAPGDVARMVPPHHRDGLAEQQSEVLDRVREGTPDDAVEVLRPEFEEWRRGIDPSDLDDTALAERFTLGVGRDLEILRGVPVAVRARSAREALARPDGYLRDAALMFRPWEFDVRAVSCPVVVRHGGLDTSASPRNAEWLAGALPRADVVLDPGDSHLAALHDHWPDILAG